MKTTIKSSVLIMVLVIGINAKAQKSVLYGGPKFGTFIPHTQVKNNPPSKGNTYSTPNGQNQWVITNGNWGQNYGPGANVTIGFGTHPYGAHPHYGYYGNAYSLKKSAKYAIRSAGHFINDAVGFTSWHDIYSPILAKAIRHYNYARQVYYWGNYNAAMHHAERAQYLAWYSLHYFQNPDYYNGNNGNGYAQPDPYDNLYDPYYKKADHDGEPLGNAEEGMKKQILPEQERLDAGLPKSELDDKELIRTFDRSSAKDE